MLRFLFSIYCILFLQLSLFAQIPTNGLVGYWPFNNNANDSSGNNNHGVVNGATLVKDRFGNCNQAYKFNGVNNTIVVPNSPTVNFANGVDFSVAFWIKVGATNYDGIPLSKNQYGSWSGYQFFVNIANPGYCNTPLHASFYTSSAAGQDACSNNPIDTNWHFFAGVFNASTNQSFFYVDAVVQADIGQSTGGMSTTSNLFFGSNTAYGNQFTGILDAIRLYNRKLTQAEITQLYNEPNPGSSVLTPTLSATNATICAGQQATLTVIGASTYTWSAGANATAPGLAVASPSATSIYTITGGNASCPGRTTSTVTVLSLPVLSVNSVTACPGQVSLLTASGALSYTWSAGATSTGINTATVAPNTTAHFTVTGSDANCTSSAVATISVAPLMVSVNSPTICAGQTALLNATGATSYTWSAGIIPVSSNSATVSPLGNTSYTLTGETGTCSDDTVFQVFVNSLPIVTIPSQTVCSGVMATLSASGATTYTWPTGITLTTANTATFIVNATAVYTVTGTSNGCSSFAGFTVSAISAPQIVVSSATICVGQTATLTANGAGSYTWSPGATPIGTNTATVNPTSTTIYSVSASNAQCTSVETATVSVISLAIAVNSPSVCAGHTATLVASGANSYTWSPGIASLGNNSGTVMPLTTTGYTITGETNGCLGITGFSVYVIPDPVMSIGNTTVCAGNTFTLMASGASTYTWLPNGHIGNDISATLTNSTTYTVIGSQNTCTAVAIVSVTVNQPPTVTIIGNPVTGCIPLCVNLQSVFSSDVLSSNWIVDGILLSGLNSNGSYCFNVPGTHTVGITATNGNGCTVVSPGLLVHAFPLPLANFTTDGELITENPDLHFIDESSSDAMSWTWDFGDGSYSHDQNPNHDFELSGIYMVNLMVQNLYGCRDSVEKAIVIQDAPCIYIPNTFTPNGDELNDFFMPKAIGIENFRIQIYDRWGEEVFESGDIYKGWDGTYKGKRVEIGVYVWKMTYKFYNRQEVNKVGQVNVVD